MSNDDVKMVFSPQVGSDLCGTGATAWKYRSAFPRNVWYYNPWTAECRTVAEISDDPYGHRIVPVNLEQVVADFLRVTVRYQRGLDTAVRGLDTAVREHGELRGQLDGCSSSLEQARRELANAKCTADALRKTVHLYQQSLAAAVRERAELKRQLENERMVKDLKRTAEAVCGIPDLADIEKRVASWREWATPLSQFWGIDPAKPGSDETVIAAGSPTGRINTSAFKGIAHLIYGGEGSPQLQRKVARQAKTLREQEVLIEKLKARLREVLRNDWIERKASAIAGAAKVDSQTDSEGWTHRTAAEVNTSAAPSGLTRTDMVQVEYRNGVRSSRRVSSFVWGLCGITTIVKWRRAR